MFDSFIGEATAVFITAGVGLAAKSAKSPVLKLVPFALHVSPIIFS